MGSPSKIVADKRQIRILFLFLCILVIISITFITKYKKLPVIVRDIGYLTRPIWDTELEQPKIIIPHYYYSTNSLLVNNNTTNTTNNANKLCELHGWKLRSNNNSSKKFKVIDAFIFSIELDLLEIRMKELWNVVDEFLVLEATRTFTGKSKSLYLQDNLESFNWAKSKLKYRIFTGLVPKLPENETPFYNEIKMRNEMNLWIHSIANNGDLVIVSDIDEIPRSDSIQLFKQCDNYPSTMIHLQMQNYLYSFDFPLQNNNEKWHWRPQINVYNDEDFSYQHGKGGSEYLLADSGWHCSFCFKHLSDFIFKMTSYSHNDRLTDSTLIENMQQRICNGENIFNMYPEAYTFKDLYTSIGPIPKQNSAIGIPNYIVENSDRFKYLLPGGCKRPF